MNRVLVIIETDQPDRTRHNISVEAIFTSPDFTRKAVLDVFESALRGAGFQCPYDALAINDGDAA